MKKIIGMLAICGSLLVLAGSVLAQTPAASECTDEAKTALYTDFTSFRTSDSKKAYEAGKKYLACSQQEDQYTTYIKKWVAAYEKEARKLRLPVTLYNDKKYPEAMALGKEILAEDPNNLKVMIDLGYLGYLATVTAKNETFNTESLGFARQAIKLIESGKTPASSDWTPFKSKDEALAYLYHAIGRLTLRSNSPETLTSLIKAAQFESDVKKDPFVYYFIAAAYESGAYTKLSADYKACCEGKDETPQSKLILANIQQVIDRMVDAYARAVALGTDPKFQASKTEWMESLKTWYKFRHNDTEAGLPEMIASVMSKPLPPEPTPLTALPAEASTTSTPTSSGAAPTTTMAPTTTSTTAAANSAKPAASPNGTATPAKPKPRN